MKMYFSAMHMIFELTFAMRSCYLISL